MAKHRRYPVKQKQKAKSKDPLQRLQRESKNKKPLNSVPSKDELDDQKLSRKWLNIQEEAKKATNPRTRSGKKRAKNKFFELTAQMGFKKRPWENDAMLKNRVIRANEQAIDDEIMKVQTGTAGRDIKELEEDFKKLDDMERRKRLLKVAQAEKRRKLREKEERFRQSQLVKHDNFEEYGDPAENVREETILKPVKKKKQIDTESKKRLTSSEKLRLKTRQKNAETRKYLMFNAREIIPFGERVDAPPEFGSELRKKFEPLHAEAGKKDLLFKNMLEPETKNLYSGQKSVLDDANTKVTEEERQRYINIYRKLKLSKK